MAKKKEGKTPKVEKSTQDETKKAQSKEGEESKERSVVCEFC